MNKDFDSIRQVWILPDCIGKLHAPRTLAADRDNLPALIAVASAYATAVLKHLDSAPVAGPLCAHVAASLTPAGIGAEKALRRFSEIVERDCALARELGKRIQRSESFDLLAPVRLNIVRFAHCEDET